MHKLMQYSLTFMKIINLNPNPGTIESLQFKLCTLRHKTGVIVRMKDYMEDFVNVIPPTYCNGGISEILRSNQQFFSIIIIYF